MTHDKPGARPFTVLLTGLSAAGKTTLGHALTDALRARGLTVTRLDGEEVRARLEKLDRRYGFSPEDRHQVALQIAQLARDENDAGNVAVVCAIAGRRATREAMHGIVGRMMEVHLDCPADECAKRDYKGHYAKARAGTLPNFVGVTEPYERSDDVALRLPTHELEPSACVERLLEAIATFTAADDEDALAEPATLQSGGGGSS